jgi:hypothetical protein
VSTRGILNVTAIQLDATRSDPRCRNAVCLRSAGTAKRRRHGDAGATGSDRHGAEARGKAAGRADCGHCVRRRPTAVPRHIEHIRTRLPCTQRADQHRNGQQHGGADLHSWRRADQSRPVLGPDRGHLSRRRVHRQDARVRVRPRRSRACRSSARSAGHALRAQHARRGNQSRHPPPIRGAGRARRRAVRQLQPPNGRVLNRPTEDRHREHFARRTRRDTRRHDADDGREFRQRVGQPQWHCGAIRARSGIQSSAPGGLPLRLLGRGSAAAAILSAARRPASSRAVRVIAPPGHSQYRRAELRAQQGRGTRAHTDVARER